MIAAAMYVIVIEDDSDESRQAVLCRNPLNDLAARMRREMENGRDAVNWRFVDGAKVA